MSVPLRQRLRSALRGTGTAMLTGAFFFVVIGPLDPNRREGRWAELVVFGAVYALTVLGVIRLLGARSWALLFAGLLCGPVPAALFDYSSAETSARGGVLFATAVLGAFVGLFEWSRQAHAARQGSQQG